MENENFPTELTLKDGRVAIIRAMVLEDEALLSDFFSALPLEDRQFLRNDVTKPEIVHRFVTDDTHDRVQALVAEYDGKIIASADLQRSHYGWMRHVGELRAIVAHEFQMQGIGVFLIRMLVKVAIMSGIEKIVAQTASNRRGAIKALESLGLRREAVLKRHVKDMTGRKRDLVIFTDDVGHIWDVMESLVQDYHPNVGH